MTAIKADSFPHPLSSLLSKEYKGIAGLPEKPNILKANSLKITRQHRFLPIWQLCPFPSKANSTNFLNRFHLHFLAIHNSGVARFFLRLADGEGA